MKKNKPQCVCPVEFYVLQWNDLHDTGWQGDNREPGASFGEETGRVPDVVFLEQFHKSIAKLSTRYRNFPYTPCSRHMHGLPRYPNTHQNGTFVTTREPTLTHCYHPVSHGKEGRSSSFGGTPRKEKNYPGPLFWNLLVLPLSRTYLY